MTEKIYLGGLLMLFLSAFIIRNILTSLSVKQSIRGSSLKLAFSIILSTIIYLLISLRLFSVQLTWDIAFGFSKFVVIKPVGYFLTTFGFVTGMLTLVKMKNSWRVGIRYDQKTDLLTTGIFKISRNPYFLSYDLFFLGFVFIFPSLILIIAFLTLAIIFHLMILEEEKYLKSVHGDSYAIYTKKVSRYLRLK